MLLRNARLIDGTGAVLEGVDIAVEGERIAAIGPGHPRPRPATDSPDTEEMDLSGATVIPGLINLHVHLLFDAGPDPLASAEREAPAYLAIQATRRAEDMLKAGITTARDMGGVGHADVALKQAIQKKVVPGPRLLVSGKVLTITGGHCWSLGVEADGPDDIRRAARAQIKAGADVVKLMATGGVLTPGVEPGAAQLTEEEMRAAVEEAHKAGRLSAAHAQGTVGIWNAVRAGIDSIEHGFFLTEPLCEEMVRRGVFFVPTLAATHHILEQGMAAGIPSYVVEKTRRIMEAHRESVILARRMGVPVVVGTDAGAPFNRHDDIATELRLLVGTGFSPMEALQAATAEAARLLRMEDEIGTVKVGQLADLVILDGDPLEDITAVSQVRAVIQAGRRV